MNPLNSIKHKFNDFSSETLVTSLSSTTISSSPEAFLHRLYLQNIFKKLNYFNIKNFNDLPFDSISVRHVLEKDIDLDS